MAGTPPPPQARPFLILLDVLARPRSKVVPVCLAIWEGLTKELGPGLLELEGSMLVALGLGDGWAELYKERLCSADYGHQGSPDYHCIVPESDR